MKTRRRIILRTETFERISLRQTSKITRCQTLELEIYKIEISQIKADERKLVFETGFIGTVEIKENEEEMQISIQKTNSRKKA